jgi:leader peptidase (prepilin peptidase)/N-methyltransferase
MDYILMGFIFFTGSAVGSFLNVVVYRIPLEQSILWPASFCPSCRVPVRPFDNVPIFGYLRLGGRCRFCRKPISFQYPLVEAVTGSVALASALWLGYSVEAAALFVFFALLLSIALIDARHYIIPDMISYPGMVIGLAFSLVRTDPDWKASVLGLLIGAGTLLGIRLLGSLLFRKEAMGLGDVKLLGLMGAFIGWQASILSIFSGSLLGTLYSIPILIAEFRSGRRGDHYVPFGPFLAGGGLLAAVLKKTSLWVFWPF